MKLLIVVLIIAALLVPASAGASEAWTQLFFSENPIQPPENLPDYDHLTLFYMRGIVKGYPEAQFMMGYSYYMGNGVRWDEDKAKEYFEKAADQGYGPAQLMLKYMKENE